MIYISSYAVDLLGFDSLLSMSSTLADFVTTSAGAVPGLLDALKNTTIDSSQVYLHVTLMCSIEFNRKNVWKINILSRGHFQTFTANMKLPFSVKSTHILYVKL